MAAAAVALVAWAGLVLQYWIIIGNLGVALGSWRFVGFFTILTNLGVASIATALAIERGRRLTSARARLMGLTSIVLVGLVYSLLLRSLWSPTGLQKVADMLLHDITPILFAALWWLMPHGDLRWSDFKWALIPPGLYLAYALGRGALDGWYAYWFLNSATQTVGELTVSIAGVMVLFSLIAAGAIGLDQWVGKRARLAQAT